ncbi:hypothetical protein PoB_007586900 [Plakobranchus ocellatus]|uniref:Uncharacterized protein n=1 Tax=Plakobranchus ocellatus TaxID=259542 RepID=A0AAV4DZ68_9GAST|nr:hypothetical protein PoB_007586900 [Plakobranchus ocellatus]
MPEIKDSYTSPCRSGCDDAEQFSPLARQQDLPFHLEYFMAVMTADLQLQSLFRHLCSPKDEGQAEQENHDLLPRPQQGRESQEEGEAERENREDGILVDANDENLQKRGRKRTQNLLNGKGTYKND